MNQLENIHSELLNDTQRIEIPARLFGLNFPNKLEPTIYSMADMLAPAYLGGYWNFYTLSNGGFYLAPASDTIFDVSCENGFDGKLSADALGITASLYAYSHLSFGEGEFAQVCAEHYHLLRDYMLEHAEARAILRAID
jgi:hypothetical protein